MPIRILVFTKEYPWFYSDVKVLKIYIFLEVFSRKYHMELSVQCEYIPSSEAFWV